MLGQKDLIDGRVEEEKKIRKEGVISTDSHTVSWPSSNESYYKPWCLQPRISINNIV